jgi:hypothetical protein
LLTVVKSPESVDRPDDWVITLIIHFTVVVGSNPKKESGMLLVLNPFFCLAVFLCIGSVGKILMFGWELHKPTIIVG